ncbi:M28 family metallopeptidase [soil metagenome]
MRRLILPAALLVLTCGPARAADAVFDPTRIARHVEVLSSDAFEGRAPATPAEAKSVAYIIEQFRGAGLEPGGDPAPNGRRAWTQDVPLARFEAKGRMAVSVRTPTGSLTWSQGDQIAVRAAATGDKRVAIANAPIIFAGYGVTAPEKGWDDFKGVDLKGKIILVLVNDPDFETGQGDFGGKAMTYYGRWTYKYEEAARRGALGVLVIHETAPASYGWATVKNSNTNEIFDIVRAQPARAHAPLEGWIQRDATANLMKAAGFDFETLKSAARARDFKPVMLTGVSLSLRYDVDVRTVITRNVAGRLPGATRPLETVMYTAHWDHLGIGQPDAKGDRIYNGAIDNADGVAVLIELARAHASAPRADRSLLFLSVTAEEKGLLGSEYYAAHPLYPLGTTVADLNMDALSASGASRDFSISGAAPLSLVDDLIAVGRARGRTFSADPDPQAGRFYRSDHFSLAKVGVPAISFKSGQDMVKGGPAAGAAAAAAYNADRYHQPADQLDASWNFDGMVQDAGLLFDLGRQLANSRSWPEWKPGAEFKAERDKTAALRQ